MVVIFGVVGAKLWHELQDPHELSAAMHQILAPGARHLDKVLFGFLRWFQAGFAWYGGLLAGIAMLLYQGHLARFKGPHWTPEASGTPARALAVCACWISPRRPPPSAMASAASAASPRAMVTTAATPPAPSGACTWRPTRWSRQTRPTRSSSPTPLWELAGALVIAAILWWLFDRSRPVGWLTGMYLVLSGAARFAVEFWRINPKLYFGMSNAQVAALGSVIVGLIAIGLSAARNIPWSPGTLSGSPLSAPETVVPATVVT